MEAYELAENSKAIFVSYLTGYNALALENCVRGYNSDVYLAITNGDQADVEDRLEKDGWKVLQTGVKDQHMNQREIESRYIKLWYLDPKEFTHDPQERLKKNINRLKRQPGYEFLNWSKERCQELPLVNYNGMSQWFKSVKSVGFSTTWPFFSYWGNCDKDTMEEVKKIFIDKIGFIPPFENPFDGTTYYNYVSLNNIVDGLKNGTHLIDEEVS